MARGWAVVHIPIRLLGTWLLFPESLTQMAFDRPPKPFPLNEYNAVVFGLCARNQAGQILQKRSQNSRALFAGLQFHHLKL
jgi:hypothetical protein